jgi:hypothetical protein
LGYLYFTLVGALMILIVIALMFFTRAKEKPNPRLNQKSKSPRNMAQSPSTIPAGQIKNLIGRKYIPSYQSDLAVAKHVDRFLSGATSRSDNYIAEKKNDADEDAADEILLGDNGRDHPAGEKDEKEAIKAQKAVQLELGMGDTKDQLTAVNE